MIQREMPNDKYDYLYEMRKLCIIDNMVFLQCDNCKRVDVASTDEENSEWNRTRELVKLGISSALGQDRSLKRLENLEL